MMGKRIIAFALAMCLFTSSALADGFFSSVGNWFSNTFNSIGSWINQAWEDTSTYVENAWTSGTDWIATNWNNFTLWITTTAAGSPYTWINDMVLENGLLAYEGFTSVRTFLAANPTEEQLQAKYDELLYELSLLEEDKAILWNMLQQWAEEKQLPFLPVAEIALPFLQRLVIAGSATIGEGAVFSGPVVAQYLMTILNTIKLDSPEIAYEWTRILQTTLDHLTRPVVIGDSDQNVLVTDDGYYIENFTFAAGKYQLIMVASMKDPSSIHPLMRGQTIDQLTARYMQDAGALKQEACESINGFQTSRTAFVANVSGIPVTGKAVAVWTNRYDYLFFMVTDQEWSDGEFADWLASVQIDVDDQISFAVDMESDGSFYGVNQSAQKYTIIRIMNEERFRVPRTGHGWAAERGNNLIDNIKGFVKGQHSTVVGDNNVKDGADRMTTYRDGSTLLIQTKYYSDAARGIAACFREGRFRYLDADGNPMAIEVPSDQYDAAVHYMKNRIKNGEVPNVDPADTQKALEIVKKGHLTYNQAKHIAKAGTVESILYDAANACISAGTSMGISAAVDFALSLWEGQPVEAAIKRSIYRGLQTGGASFVISVLSSQLSKSGLNAAMIPASKVIVHSLGPKVSAVIVNAFRPAGSAIYGAAAMQSAAKLLRGNTITAVVSFVVLSAADVADIIQGKISWKQLAKNTSTTACGIVGGALGYLGGAALGTAILPGAGTLVGIIVSVAAGWGASEGADAVADMIAEDDAEEMIAIIENSFTEIAPEYFLSQAEVDEAILNLQALLTADMLKQMYQYKEHETFARQLIEMAIDPVVAKRQRIELPSEEEYAAYVVDTLNGIYAELENESTSEAQ